MGKNICTCPHPVLTCLHHLSQVTIPVSITSLEVFVEFPQIDGIFSSAVGGQILLGVNREVRVVSFVSEERGHTSSLTRRVVVGKLSQRKQLGPVVLLVVAVGVEVLFEGLIDLLGLTISFRMIS